MRRWQRSFPCRPWALTPPLPPRPAIYDEKADGAKQIAQALTMARKENNKD